MRRNNRSYLLYGPQFKHIIRDTKRRILFDIFERERRNIKKQLQTTNLSVSTMMKLQQLLQELPGIENKIKNRCMVTGRSRSIIRHFKLSRIMLRDLASYGMIPGLRKSSW